MNFTDEEAQRLKKIEELIQKTGKELAEFKNVLDVIAVLAALKAIAFLSATETNVMEKKEFENWFNLFYKIFKNN